ncbi:acid Co-A ligase [Aureobasidium pullulans]|uniref:Acid Co-A ligase n=1 Tax=Aureobasidium pullulans TaxID=5580 RepID=A0A4S9K7Z5_AURPU|nr:acid Co-A ligase [Aureobasidium pullulans]THY11847.1 acid Co-A ligase [Aureobasidium pullulans]THY26796.1 acid Co-A ligase [Aureobasidium pullulans]
MQTINNIYEVNTPKAQLSVFHGPADPPLVTVALGEFLDIQCERYGEREALVFPWAGTRWTYNDLKEESSKLARYLYSRGIRPGDRVAILAGNRVEYASVFFACMRIGAVLVILNNTYTIPEAQYALQYTGRLSRWSYTKCHRSDHILDCKILFATPTIGKHIDNSNMLRHFSNSDELPALQQIIILADNLDNLLHYQDAIKIGSRLPNEPVKQVQDSLSPYETCNLQFTSGSTGHPKAAMLTHHGLLNNSRFIGDRMSLTAEDVLCCPPPMFHCFGLVLGMLACLTHGAKIVYPSEIFDGPSVLQAITDERCTAIHGVPAMFDTLFSLPRPAGFNCDRLRTGIIAGAPVPRHLMELLVNEFGMTEFTSSYGLTEASPTCFNAFVDDSIDRRLTTVGTLMPHAHAKIVDKNNRIVPVGTRGELCIAGYQLQQGYFRNAEKTAEAMERDADGVLWLHTGDEAVFDRHGYCSITGRFKDIIIRGGENIYPLEIEERLIKHDAVERAIVVGLPHTKYGEVVAAFLQRATGASKPSDEEVREWTRQTLGRHKAPAHVFWLGENGVTDQIPITGSGKIKKFEMRKIGQDLLASMPKAKL